MLSDSQQELIEAFSEVRVVGQEFADKANVWNDTNLDEDNHVCRITQDMSGDTVVACYTEDGIEEDTVCQMLDAVGFTAPEESDDAVIPEEEIKQGRNISEGLNEFLVKSIAISEKYAPFIKDIELQEGNHLRREEVRIVIPAEKDIRKLPAQDPCKSKFMHFLQDIREIASQYSMTDEAFCFCRNKNEFYIILHPYGKST